jgi:hypothetical protein
MAPSVTMIAPTSTPIIITVALNASDMFTSCHFLLLLWLLPAKGTIEKI